ncbi:non-ribosomal peptide synthetase [Pedobacter sp. BAL39]|uniref:non-ribosomal peptide synthetase n=1 Tax=Pedobacter sp. BAL39 TaxID=391596 RepID=UPI0018DC909C|nr:non-ribosomal peptide synthetase [Pedobacter sp. BAL39]
MERLNFINIDFNPFEGFEIEKVVLTNESQRELWLSCVLGGEDASLAYNESISLTLEGRVDNDAFQQSIKALILRHEALRACMSKNGEHLIIHTDVHTDLDSHDISDLSERAQTSKVKSDIQEWIGEPFDIYEAPLFKMFVHILGDNRIHFTLIIHHIIGDGWSIGIILEDLSKLYNAYLNGEVPQLPPAEQISDYAEEQASFGLTEEYQETQQFWLDQYKDDVPVLNLPLDFSKPSTRTYRGKRNDYPLNPELLAALKKLAVKSGSSLVATMITAFEVYLYHRTGQQDIVLGLPSAGQSATGYFGLVGHCVNLLPLKSKINPDLPFSDYLKIRKGQIYDAYDHQRLTFSELLKKLNIKRDKSSIPLVPVVFNVDMGMDEKVKFQGLKHTLFSNPRVCQTFEISLNVNGSKESMMLEWAYNTQLFSSATIDRMMGELELLLKTVTENPSVLVSAAMPHPAPFPEIARNKTNTPAALTLVDLFSKQVESRPDHLALVFGTQTLSYEQLDKKSNQVANYLISKGVSGTSMVPLCIRPSLEMVIGILGVMKTGAAYVPIDPELPEQRKHFILSATTGEAFLTDQYLAGSSPEITEETGLALNNASCPVWSAATTKPSVTINQQNLIYIIYTSGSTGNPKGVMIEHGAITDYIYGLQDALPQLKLCKSFALGSSVATDLGNTVLFGALATGATLHVFAKEDFNNPIFIHQYFKSNAIDFLKVVPSHWKYLMLDDQGLFPERVLMFGGESLPGDFIQGIRDSNHKCSIVNHYGPTETTIGKLLHIVNMDNVYQMTVPIGKPFSNTVIYVVDKHFNHCPVGVPGELYIGGRGLAKGYLGNPALTDQSFIKDPFATTPEAKIYKTGDLVRWLPDGNIQYMGRIDDQIKIRGNRIELGEIQNVLLSHADVLQCAVVVEENQGNEKQLAAYIVQNGVLDKELMIQHLQKSLPEYMIPRMFLQLDQIPLTANGKINRKLLPKIEQEEALVFVAPSGGDEELIADIWAKCLGLDKVSTKDNFFELGGHSLIAIKVMVEIEKQTGKRLPLASLFDSPTVEKLAKLLNVDAGMKWNALVPIHTQGSKLPVYLIHGGGLNILVFQSMSKFMDPDQPVYALQALGLNGDTELLYTIEEIAKKYVSEIMEVDAEGPYLLAGYSLGGKIAYEMARQLMAMGKEIKMLGIFDTYTGSSHKGMNRIVQKGLRQLRKVPFILGQLIDNPKRTISYQLLIAKRKMNKLTNKKKVHPESEVFSYDPEIARSYETAYFKYELAPMDIKIDLFRVKERIYYLDDRVHLGWKPYGLKGISVHDIPGDHKTFLYPPNDREFAGVLQQALNEKN